MIREYKEGTICFYGRQKCVVIKQCKNNKEKVYIKTTKGKPFIRTNKNIKLVKIEKLCYCVCKENEKEEKI